MTTIRHAAQCALAVISFALAVLLSAAPAQAQATRTWVSGVGDDVNPCSRTAPCKTFAGAISKTAAGGEIDCLDPGGFGTVTITKSITIDCTGTLGSILNSGGINGVVVNDSATATPGTVQVILRGLTIDGAGVTPGLNGVRFISGKSLYIEDVFIQNQKSGNGISFQPTAAATLKVVNSSIVGSGGGIRIQPTGAAGNARAIVTNVEISGLTGDAVRVDSTGNTFVGANTVDVENTTISMSAAGVNAVTAVGTAQSIVTVRNSTLFNIPGAALLASGTGNSLIRASGNTITQNAFVTSATGGAQIQSFGDNLTLGNSNAASFTGAVLVKN
jgi:hypothetical protein